MRGWNIVTTQKSHNSHYFLLTSSKFHWHSMCVATLMFSTCLSVHPFVCYQTCKQEILTTNVLIFMQISANGPRDKARIDQRCGSRGQRSHDDRVRRSKVTWWQRLIWKPEGGIIVSQVGSRRFSSSDFLFGSVWTTHQFVSIISHSAELMILYWTHITLCWVNDALLNSYHTLLS